MPGPSAPTIGDWTPWPSARSGRAHGRAAAPTDIEPGVYPVVLSEYAVAEVLEYLAFMAFSGLAIEEGRACVELGEQVFGSNVTIWDDGGDPTGIPTAIDFEVSPAPGRAGVRGVAREPRTRRRNRTSGRRATDRSRAAGPNTFGPLCWNLFMAPGPPARGAARRRRARPAHHPVPLREHRPSQEGDPDRDDPRRDVPHRERGGCGSGTQPPLHAVHPGRVFADLGHRGRDRLVEPRYTGIITRVPAVRIEAGTSPASRPTRRASDGRPGRPATGRSDHAAQGAPCGSHEWSVVRLGADIGLVCAGCNQDPAGSARCRERRYTGHLEQGPEPAA